jgi:hypothetical protein
LPSEPTAAPTGDPQGENAGSVVHELIREPGPGWRAVTSRG